MNKTYTIAKFDDFRNGRYVGRTIWGTYGSWAQAANVLRSLGPQWFIQGPKRAWFYEDVAR